MIIDIIILFLQFDLFDASLSTSALILFHHIYHGNSQRLVDKENRIHCSLNLNTETGRLSSRKPNLQNQPALEKDQYKISE